MHVHSTHMRSSRLLARSQCWGSNWVGGLRARSQYHRPAVTVSYCLGSVLDTTPGFLQCQLGDLNQHLLQSPLYPLTCHSPITIARTCRCSDNISKVTCDLVDVGPVCQHKGQVNLRSNLLPCHTCGRLLAPPWARVRLVLGDMEKIIYPDMDYFISR